MKSRSNHCLMHALVLAVVTMIFHAGGERAFCQNSTPDEAIASQIVPPFAWSRLDRYEPPDFESFFPDDPEAGEQLDEMLTGKLQLHSVDERLALIRRVLRHTSRHRTTLLRSVGNEFIWNRTPQDPRAIELLYHASDSPDRDVAHYALYHGATVVSDRTPNLVRMLMERFSTFHAEIQNRIPWGMRTYGDKDQTRTLLHGLLDSHAILSDATVCAAIDTYQEVFETTVPNVERFEMIGQWVVAFHRTDLSSDHPRAAKILREDLDHISLKNQQLQLTDFVTRVDDGHETAVVLVQGVKSRAVLTEFLSRRGRHVLDFNELLSAQSLQRYRLREFAVYLPEGLPSGALPTYTRPQIDKKHSWNAVTFVAPDFYAYFADDEAAGKELDQVYANRKSINLSDRELLNLFRRGVRRSENSPNVLFGWISGALGWPTDPQLTETLYQGVDLNAPKPVRDAAVYYGFGLGVQKSRNILEAMYHVYMAPPFDRTSNGNLRSRILWGVREHEDDKYFLSTLFAAALRDHASLTDPALLQADVAYRQLTDEAPQNAEDYATRGLFVVIASGSGSDKVDATRARLIERLGESEHLVDMKVVELNGKVMVLALARGRIGQTWLVEKMQLNPRFQLLAVDLLTREFVDKA